MVFKKHLQVPSREVDKDAKKFWSHWNLETKQVRQPSQLIEWYCFFVVLCMGSLELWYIKSIPTNCHVTFVILVII